MTARELKEIHARFPTFSELKIAKMLELVRVGTPLKAAAAAARIGWSSFRRWREGVPYLSDRVEMARGEAVAAKVSIVTKASEGSKMVKHPCPVKTCDGVIEVAAKVGSWTAAAWWLERVHHQDFGRKDILESKVEVRVRVEVSKLAVALVLAVNEEVRNVDDRERLRERLMAEFGPEGAGGDFGGGQTHTIPGQKALPPGPPPGTEGTQEAPGPP